MMLNSSMSSSTSFNTKLSSYHPSSDIKDAVKHVLLPLRRDTDKTLLVFYLLCLIIPTRTFVNSIVNASLWKTYRLHSYESQIIIHHILSLLLYATLINIWITHNKKWTNRQRPSIWEQIINKQKIPYSENYRDFVLPRTYVSILVIEMLKVFIHGSVVCYGIFLINRVTKGFEDVHYAYLPSNIGSSFVWFGTYTNFTLQIVLQSICGLYMAHNFIKLMKYSKMSR